jgi:hypothetical protein
MRKSGKVLIAAQEALEYGLVEIDGKESRLLKIKHF